MYKGTLDGSRVCIKRVRMYLRGSPEKPTKVHIDAVAFAIHHHSQIPQAFCQEAVMWKRLKHPNILPLLGITVIPLQLISNWMSNGDLPEYLRRHSDADRLELVCVHPVVLIPRLFPSPAI